MKQQNKPTFKKAVLIPWETYEQLKSNEQQQLKTNLGTSDFSPPTVIKDYDKKTRNNLLKDQQMPSELKMKVFDEMYAHTHQNPRLHHSVQTSTMPPSTSEITEENGFINSLAQDFEHKNHPIVSTIFKDYLYDNKNRRLVIDPFSLEPIINGERLPSSNIVEILKYLLDEGDDKNPRQAPLGTSTVYKTLLQMGVPGRWFRDLENSSSIQSKKITPGEAQWLASDWAGDDSSDSDDPEITLKKNDTHAANIADQNLPLKNILDKKYSPIAKRTRTRRPVLETTSSLMSDFLKKKTVPKSKRKQSKVVKGYVKRVRNNKSTMINDSDWITVDSA